MAVIPKLWRSVRGVVFAVALVLSVHLGEAQPLITPDAPVMNLDEIGVYSVGYAYRLQAEQQFPLGWSGFFDDKTGIACEAYGTQKGRRVFLLHPPWRGGTGITFQQFAFRIPTNATGVSLRGATAIKSDIVTNSDGVTFRVLINGTKVLDTNRTTDVWADFDFNLTAFRGSNVTIRFETDPGPANNASFDYAFWGARDLILSNYTATPVTHPAPPSLDLAKVLSAQTGDVSARSGFAGVNSFALSNGVAHFFYAGPDGTLDFAWIRPTNANDGLFGTITLKAQMTGDAPVSVPLAGSVALTWTNTATAQTNGWQTTNNGVVLQRTFSIGATTAVVRVHGRISGKSLSFTTTCDQPRVTAFDGGMWGPAVRRQQVTTPFYSGQVFFLPQENLFINAFLDHTASSATSISANKATYSARTDATRVKLSERVIFSVGWHLAEAFPNLTAPPSPWRDFLAGKVILDIWSGSFSNIAQTLTNLAGYGITNCVALIHNWQRSGYDNALPAHVPANASLGGDVGMSNLVSVGSQLGIRVALHENYVDYYPNYDFYNTNDIALSSGGALQNAWFNPGTGIQSFALKPNAILGFAGDQSAQIKARYNTVADYLDVHSAVPPWFHVDMRAVEAGAGMFSRVWDVHRQLWAFERATHGGPVFGEGNNHWYWSGYLDGVEAQFGQGVPVNGGLSAPLNVDFNLLKIHPLQFNHGMGYYERWWPDNFETNWAGLPPMILLDQYRMQEVVFGHAGFLSSSTWNSVPLAWLEHHLLWPVTSSHGAAAPVSIQYEANGSWIDSTAAVKSETGATNNRIRIQYNNGLSITANGASNSFQSGSWLLPQFGWIAEGAGFSAGTVLRSNVVVDFCDTADALFVNARPASDWNLSSYRRVKPAVTNFTQLAARQFRVTYQWQVDEALGRNYNNFVHFTTNGGGSILWQQDHALTPSTVNWLPGQIVSDGPWTITISTNIADGDYDWLIGLFDTATGSRLKLSGVDDGSSRIRLGVLQVRTNGTAITFTAETKAPGYDPTPWYAPHLNTSNLVVNFGDLRTDGSVWVRREGDAWFLKPWPRSRNFTIELNGDRFGFPRAVASVNGTNALVTPSATTSNRWRLPLNGAGEYRWTNDGFRTSALINTGSVWKYLDTGINLGTAWRVQNYNDSAWPSGPAQLGFGDFDEATTIASNRQVTTYFRRAFTVGNAASITALSLRLLRDDGAVVFLNGTEVLRSNMTNGAITYATLAISNVPAADETTNFYSAVVSPGLLVAGTNIIAVEVHQASAASSDLSFDLELVATSFIASRPRIAFASGGLSWSNSTGTGAFALFETTNLNPPANWVPVTGSIPIASGSWTVPLTATGAARFFRLQIP